MSIEKINKKINKKKINQGLVRTQVLCYISEILDTQED